MAPDWFLKNTERYDRYDRSGPKVLRRICRPDRQHHERQEPQPSWKARCQAAFMTGLERNGDVVQMASYAPLLPSNGRLAVDARRHLV
jgi:alpha-N-arabinofuranosidase